MLIERPDSSVVCAEHLEGSHEDSLSREVSDACAQSIERMLEHCALVELREGLPRHPLSERDFQVRVEGLNDVVDGASSDALADVDGHIPEDSSCQSVILDGVEDFLPRQAQFPEA